MIRPPPRSTRVRSSAASDVYKRQVKGRDKLREQLWTVPFRIQRDEQDLYPVHILAKQMHNLRQIGQRGGAYLGTVGITKEQHDHFSPEIQQAARLAIKIGKLEISMRMLPGDVFGMVRRRHLRLL